MYIRRNAKTNNVQHVPTAWNEPANHNLLMSARVLRKWRQIPIGAALSRHWPSGHNSRTPTNNKGSDARIRLYSSNGIVVGRCT